jgi:hypothetical protein
MRNYYSSLEYTDILLSVLNVGDALYGDNMLFELKGLSHDSQKLMDDLVVLELDFRNASENLLTELKERI